LRNLAFNDLTNSIKIPDNWKKRGGIPEEYLNSQGEIQDMNKVLKDVIRYKIGSSGIEISLADLRKEGVREALTEGIQIDDEGNFNGEIKTREDLIRALGISGGGGTSSSSEDTEPEEEFGPSTPRMAEHFDENKHEQTDTMVKRYKNIDEDFYESREYLDNQDEYESGVDYRRHENALNQKEIDKVRGVATASTRKQGAEQAGVGLNFNNLDIQKALGVTSNFDAAYYSGQGKEKVVKIILEKYAKELGFNNTEEIEANVSKLEEIKQLEDEIKSLENQKNLNRSLGAPSEMNRKIDSDIGDLNRQLAPKKRTLEGKLKDLSGFDKLKRGLGNADTLRVHNNASMSSRADQARHERAHARTQNLSDNDFNEIWNSMDENQQQEISQDLKSRYPNLTDKQMKQEAVAEMVGVGDGIYKANKSTRKVLNNMKIKTRGRDDEGEAAIEKMSEVGAIFKAGVNKVKQGSSRLADTLVKKPISKDGERSKKKKRDRKEIKENEEIQKKKNKKIEKATSILEESKKIKKTSKEEYNDVKQINGKAIQRAERDKLKNTKVAKEKFEEAEIAKKEGKAKKAYNLTKEGNKLLNDNIWMDKNTINPLQNEIKKFKKNYEEAVSRAVKDYENLDKLISKPNIKPSINKGKQEIKEEKVVEKKVVNEKDQKEKKIVKKTPKEIVDSAQEEVKEEVKKIDSDKLDSTAIVSALSKIEDILMSVESSLEEMPPSTNKVDKKENSKLNGSIKDFIKDIKQAQSTNKNILDAGGTLDPMSTKSFLARINTNLQKLNKNPKPLDGTQKKVFSTNTTDTNNTKK